MRALLVSVAALALVSIAQPTSTLHIKVTVDGRSVVRHALLISDVPVSASPRRVLTGTDGTVDVHLKPGEYTVESDNPVTLGGKSYQWTQMVTISSGKDATLELNASNAEIGTPAAASPDAPDLQSVFEQVESSVVTVWTETSFGLGVLVDPKGLIVTNQRIVGRSEAGEVEVAPQIKVAARVVASDLGKNLAVLWIDPSAVASVKPAPMKYSFVGSASNAARGFTVGSTLHGRKFMTPATINGEKAGTIDADITVDPGNAGGPVFTADGQVIGITTLGPRRMEGPPIPGIIAIDAAKSLIAEADKKTAGAQPPSAAHLPIEPSKPFPDDALKAAEKKAPTIIDYQVHGTEFDLTFITPVQLYAQQSRERDMERGGGGGAAMIPSPSTPAGMLSLDTFENWAEYAAQFPPVLMARVTPKMGESFWAMVGRQAAQTQGVQLPAIKRIKAGFLRMELFCGDALVTPIHPFKIQHQVESEVAYEGLYVYEPSAIGPQCGTVKVVLFGEKDPSKGDSHIVEQKTLDAIARDFASYR